jgi:hypothetical protein
MPSLLGKKIVNWVPIVDDSRTKTRSYTHKNSFINFLVINDCLAKKLKCQKRTPLLAACAEERVNLYLHIFFMSHTIESTISATSKKGNAMNVKDIRKHKKSMITATSFPIENAIRKQKNKPITSRKLMIVPFSIDRATT